MDGIEFGKILKKERIKKCISSKLLSKQADKAVTYVSQLERGLIKNADNETCKKIMNIVGFIYKEVGFEISCRSCNSNNIEINKSIDGIYFECLDCKHSINKIIKDNDNMGNLT
jgi:transcriptional regulator with XRE-family HTH domain